MFVEGEFFVVGDHDDAEVILVYFMDLVDENFADAFALIFGAHEQIMPASISANINNLRARGPLQRWEKMLYSYYLSCR